MQSDWFSIWCRGLMLLAALLLLGACTDPVSEDTLRRSRVTPPWFDNAKLGIFIHWGPASVPAFAYGPPLRPGELEDIMFGDSPRKEMPYAEWYLNAMNYPGSETARHHAATYGDAPYAEFKPTFEQHLNEGWDPDAWADLFYRAGAKYVVLVTQTPRRLYPVAQRDNQS